MIVDPVEAVANYFKNYVNFTGRSTRAEYWWVVLFTLVVSIIAGILDIVIFGTHEVTRTLGNGTELTQTVNNSQLLERIVQLAFLIPGIALIVRRIRDTGHHWAWIFTYIIPLVNIATILYFALKGSSPEGRGIPTSDKNPAGYWG